jgi:hypothetical protein
MALAQRRRASRDNIPSSRLTGAAGRITHANLVRRGEQGPASRSNARLPRRTALIRNSPCHRVPRCGAAFAEDKAGAGPQEGVSLMAARAGEEPGDTKPGDKGR